MTYIPGYYRREYTDENMLETVLKSLKSKDKVEKVQTGLDKIYESCTALNSLRYTETCSLYEFLKKNDVPVKHLVQDFLENNSADNKDISQMDIDDDEEKKKANDMMIAHSTTISKVSLEEMERNSSLLTVYLSGMNSDILEFPGLVENVLNFVINEINENYKCTKKINNESVKIDTSFSWSYMGVPKESIDNQEIFINFKDSMMLWLFVQCMNNLSLDKHDKEDDKKFNITINYDKIFETQIVDKFAEIFDYEIRKVETVQKSIILHISDMIKVAENVIKNTIKIDDYLSKCKKLSETYRVDPKDLAEVPPYLVDTVKQRIVEFRIHVLKDLENKSNLKKIEDSAETRILKLNDLYNSQNTGEPIPPKFVNDEFSDIEYETQVLNKKKTEAEKKYTMHLSYLKKKEFSRLKNHEIYLKVYKHDAYKNEIIPQKRKRLIDNFVTGVTSTKNKIDSNFSYYTKRSNYVKYRESIKRREEELDEEYENEGSCQKTDIPAKEDINN